MMGTGNDTTALPLPRLDDFGFFADSPLMHAPLPLHDMGMHMEPEAYSMATDNLLICVMLGSFVALAILYRFLRPLIYERTCALFFFTPSASADFGPDKAETGMEFHARTLTTILASLLIGCIYTSLVRESGRTYLPYLPFWLPYASHSVCVIAYFTLKYLLHGLASLVFFKKKDREKWVRENSFLTAAETMLFFCASVVIIYGNLTLLEGLFVLLFPFIFVKFVLFIKTYEILFGKMYRSLHFFVYFCALELIPALILWMFLNKITGNLTII